MSLQYTAVVRIRAMEVPSIVANNLPGGLHGYARNAIAFHIFTEGHAGGSQNGTFQITLDEAVQMAMADVAQQVTQQNFPPPPQVSGLVSKDVTDPATIAATHAYTFHSGAYPGNYQLRSCGPLNWSPKPYSISELVTLLDQISMLQGDLPSYTVAELPNPPLQIITSAHGRTSRLYIIYLIHEHVCCGPEFGRWTHQVWIHTASNLTLAQVGSANITGVLYHDSQATTIVPWTGESHIVSNVTVTATASGYDIQASTAEEMQWQPSCKAATPQPPECCCDHDRTRLTMLAGIAGIELAAAHRVHLAAYSDMVGPLLLAMLLMSLYKDSCTIKLEWIMGLAVYAAYRLAARPTARPTGSGEQMSPNDEPVYI